MVAQTSIREATPADAPAVMSLVRLMLDEMASFGGHPVSRSEEGWACFEEAIIIQIEEDQHLFLLAERAGPSPTPVGLAQASVVDREGVFEPARVLHIHALYVEPGHRRRGIAQALLQAAIEWGRAAGCAMAELNVLVRNPARGLYEGLGFRPLQTEMVRAL